MKRLLTILLLVLGTLAVVYAQEAASVKGAWEMTIETPQGAMPVGLTFTKVEGEDITGTMSSPRGDLELTGKVTGAKIAFSGSIDANGQSLTLAFTGKIENEVMSGEVDFGGMGGGSWSAKRVR